MSESDQATAATDNPVNVSDAAEGQQLQATQEIENDPQINEGAPEPGPYDDESVWGFRKLQAEIKERNADRDEDYKISGQGTREELVARLVEDDAKSATPVLGEDGEVDPANDGIELDYGLSGSHADVLQSLSDARRKAQLDAVAQADQG